MSSKDYKLPKMFSELSTGTCIPDGQNLLASVLDLEEPRYLKSDYKITEFLGVGKYSIVRKGLHRETGQTVAIKMIVK